MLHVPPPPITAVPMTPTPPRVREIVDPEGPVPLNRSEVSFVRRSLGDAPVSASIDVIAGGAREESTVKGADVAPAFPA